MVLWAGPVAGALHVTILHPDGLRTSYSFLAHVAVVRGQEVSAGEVIGLSSGRLHFGLRDGDGYLDPASLFGSGSFRVRLVPLGGPDPLGPEAELTEQRDLAGLVARAEARWGPLAHYAHEVWPGVRANRVLDRWLSWWRDRDDCTPEGVVVDPPAERRIAVLVGGLGTSSERSTVERVDTSALGYSDEDVVRFSYAGGRTPPEGGQGAALTALPSSTYGPAHTQGDLLESGGRLRELLGEVAAAAPGVPIDVIAHSQGGVVAQLALTQQVPGEPLPEAVDLVVTIGSPHDGADLATAVAAVRGTPRGDAALEWLRGSLDLPLDPDSTAIRQLSETSTLSTVLGSDRVPGSVRVLTIAARGDLTVAAPHTRLAGAEHHVIPAVGADAHTHLPGDGRTTHEIALALDGRPPSCESAFDVMADLGVSEGVSWAEDTLGFMAGVLARA